MTTDGAEGGSSEIDATGITGVGGVGGVQGGAVGGGGEGGNATRDHTGGAVSGRVH